ncbi:MAG: hypothetical protein PHE77_01925 [Candidatus Pacebacteria bacterium]|nr:hypothetical protein [Candidatus Paceibacterota bacterium]
MATPYLRIAPGMARDALLNALNVLLFFSSDNDKKRRFAVVAEGIRKLLNHLMGCSLEEIFKECDLVAVDITMETPRHEGEPLEEQLHYSGWWDGLINGANIFISTIYRYAPALITTVKDNRLYFGFYKYGYYRRLDQGHYIYPWPEEMKLLKL